MYTIFMSLCSLDLTREKRLAKVFIKKRERERERDRERERELDEKALL